MADLSLYFDIIKTFIDLNVPYVIIGAYVDHEVIARGNETVEFWNKLKKMAEEQRG